MNRNRRIRLAIIVFLCTFLQGRKKRFIMQAHSDLFKDMKSFRLKDKLLVHGFIRSLEQQLSAIEQRQHIPPLIIQLCIWYIHQREQWYNCGSVMQMNEERNTVTAVVGTRASAFGTIPIHVAYHSDTHKVYRWNLKVVKFDYENNRNRFMDIGICTDRTKQLDANFNDVQTPELFYEFDNEGTISNQESVGDRYGCMFHEGDTIGMQIDTKHQALSFYVNGQDQGPVSIEANRTYYLAVSFDIQGTCVCLLDFSEHAAM